jgi:hypothetical protein
MSKSHGAGEMGPRLRRDDKKKRAEFGLVVLS